MVHVRIDEIPESPWDTTGISDTEIVVMISHEDDTTTVYRQDLSDILEKQASLVVLLPKRVGVFAGVHGGSSGIEQITQVTEVGDILRLTVNDSEEPVES